MSPSETREIESAEAVQGSSWIGWLPLPVLPLSAVAFRNVLPPWAFMWVMAFAIYFSLKWLTWWGREPFRHIFAMIGIAFGAPTGGCKLHI